MKALNKKLTEGGFPDSMKYFIYSLTSNLSYLPPNFIFIFEFCRLSLNKDYGYLENINEN